MIEKLKHNPVIKILFIFTFFVSPLFFFTNLTRNPYFFQITLLNISIMILASYIILEWLKRKKISLIYNPIILSFLLLLFIFLLTSIYSYFNHHQFYRPSLLSEFRRIWLFTLINCFLPFFISSNISFGKKDSFSSPFNFLFIFLWGILWFLFPYLKSEAIFFDFYGFFLFIIIFFYIFVKIKEIDQHILINIALLSGFLASCYGIMQYFGYEFIWSKALNPYGRRAVSTFGNPNFISSYALMLIPFSLYYLGNAKDTNSKICYLVYSISYLGMIFASLTRSTIIGLVFLFVFLFSFSNYRKFLLSNIKSTKKFFIIALFVLILWPDQNLKPFSFGVLSRVYEGAKNSISKISLRIPPKDVYPSFHQRLMIWTSGMMMFKENPLLGNGWGSFELFYPFYQGKLLRDFPSIRSLRTHANNAHNEVIEILSQTGIIGFGASLFFLFAVIFCAIKFIRTSMDEDRKNFMIAMLGSVLAMIIDNMLNVSIHFAVPGFLFFWIIGGISFQSGIVLKEINFSFLKKIVLIILLIFLVFCSYFWITQFLREIFYFKGFKEMRGGKFLIAKESLQKAYNFNSIEVNNNYELANAYTRLGEFENAIFMYKMAINSNAGYDEIYFNLGVVQKKNGIYEDAIKNFRTSLWINPLNEKAYYACAEIMLGDINKYYQDLKILIEDGLAVHPNDSHMRNIMGYLYELKKDYSKAMEEYSIACINDPYSDVYLSNLLRISNGKKNEVIEFVSFYRDVYIKNNYDIKKLGSYLKKNEHILGTYLKFRFLKAKYYFEIGEMKISETILKDIISEDSNFYPAIYALAMVYEKTGRYDDAISQLENYLIYNPQNDKVVEKIRKLKIMK
ncbi:MAG: O-antigen ligase family protein [Elusimicrobiota bacterium]